MVIVSNPAFEAEYNIYPIDFVCEWIVKRNTNDGCHKLKN